MAATSPERRNYAFARPFSTREAAEWLGISTRQVLELIKRGDLPAKKVGCVWRFDQKKLAEFAGVDIEWEERDPEAFSRRAL